MKSFTAFALFTIASLTSINVFALSGGFESCYDKVCEKVFPSTVQFSGRVGYCSAVKISTNLFLTAGHCVKRSALIMTSLISSDSKYATGDEVESHLNTSLFTTEIKSPEWYVLKANAPFRDRKEYTSLGFLSTDVAVFKSDIPTPHIPIAPLCKNAAKEGNEVIITGWGLIANNGERYLNPRTNLQKWARVKVDKTFTGLFHVKGSQGKFLARKVEGEIMPADSGSAVYGIEDSKYCVIGINNAGIVYDHRLYPDYTIHNNLKNNEFSEVEKFLQTVIKSDE